MFVMNDIYMSYYILFLYKFGTDSVIWSDEFFHMRVGTIICDLDV